MFFWNDAFFLCMKSAENRNNALTKEELTDNINEV